MKYVLDSSVAFKTLLAEQHSDMAQRLCDDYRNHVHELLSPEVFTVEVAHAITRSERQGRISPSEGARLLTDMLNRLPAMLSRSEKSEVRSQKSEVRSQNSRLLSSALDDCRQDCDQFIAFLRDFPES
jgi:predicted nucleic acid-binding protein